MNLDNTARSDRWIAVTTGALFITGTVAGILSVVFTNPLLGEPDMLATIAVNRNPLLIGALFVLMMAFALAMVPVVMFPVLRRTHEILALGYVLFRGALETFFYLAIVISSLFLLTLSELDIAQTPAMQTVAVELLETEMLGSLLTIVFIIGALMFYTALYRSKLVPQWLSGWGLLAAVPYLAAGFLVLFGATQHMSTLDSVLRIPLGIQEMVLAVWLIAKGFDPAAVASQHTQGRYGLSAG